VQKAQERDILFLQYLCLDGTRPETRKRRQKCAGLCEVGLKQEAIEQFLDLGFVRKMFKISEASNR